jgi:ribonuclease Y
MDLVIAAALLAAGLVSAAVIFRRTGTAAVAGPAGPRGAVSMAATAAPASVAAPAPAPAPPAPSAPVPERRSRGHEEELEQRADELRAQAAELEQRADRLADETRALEREREALAAKRAEHERALEQVAGLTAGQARERLIKEVEEQAMRDASRRVRQVQEEAKRDGERRARNILAVATQRLAASHASETTVSVVQLNADDMKGRIIGREGRNIRALENLTGIDFIIDETPNAVVLSGFDGVRREVARMTLEKLLQDGRIHPARIEEAFYQAKSELEAQIAQAGEDAAFEADVPGLDAELLRVLGRLKFRTSYGQNVLAHSIECAHLAAMMADELGASARTAAGAALLHDIGKAVSHEVEGPHALVGGDLAAGTGSPRPSPTRWRPTTTRSSPRRSRPSSSRRPTRSAARGRAPAASRSSRTSSACASSSRSPSATRASRRSTRCRRAARCGSWSRPARSTTTPRRSSRTRSPARSSRSSSTRARSR